MDTDVAAFARQLKQDAVDAARAEADSILDGARTGAAAIVEQARTDAAATRAAALAALERDRTRFGIEIGLAARDAMLQTRVDIEGVVMRLLRARIADALAADEVVRTAILELIRNAGSGQGWEIAVGPRIGTALVAAAVNDLLKGREGAVAVVEEFGRSGLEFRTAGGDEVLELSEESVLQVFRRMLSPELNRLIDSLPG